ncbi:MAG: glycosyl transferase family 25 [Flavobacteriales bacterium]|nr:glycosyl transferase family 25 [Flavobacteriales bacterium]
MGLYNFPVKTYVIHAEKGYEYHGERVKTLFKEKNIPFEFMTKGSPSNFSNELLSTYFVQDILKKYSKGGISCTLNHFLALESFIESEENFALIFENDPFFIGDFQKKMNRIFPEIEALSSGFIISLENTTLTFPGYKQTNKNQFLYAASKGRMAGAYLIDKTGAEKALEYLKSNKCAFIIDWFHNELIEKNVLKMYWAHPPLIEQGSHNGHLSSTISSKNKSIYRRFAWIIRKFVRKNIGRLFNQKRIIE